MTYKTIWITGASSGLGENLAVSLAKPGISLILSSIDREKLIEVAKKCESLGAETFQVVFDICNLQELEKSVQMVLEKYTNIDILINNAGIGQRSFALDTSFEVEQKIMNTNFWPAVHLSKAVLPGMLERNLGQIVVISSISGLFSFPHRSSYAASKYALIGYFEALSLELAKTNICVTLVFPGRLKNDFSLQALTGKGDKYNKMDKSHVNGYPLEKACKKILNAIKTKKRYLIFGQNELILWRIKRVSFSLFYKIASKISIDK